MSQCNGKCGSCKKDEDEKDVCDERSNHESCDCNKDSTCGGCEEKKEGGEKDDA